MIAIDTGIWIEYINTNGRLHSQAKAVIESVNSGKATAILTPITLAEIFYVSKRVYQEVHSSQKSETLARKLYDFAFYHPHVEVKPLDYELCLNAGMIKSKYNIAFSDCFLLALSKHDTIIAVFKNIESEMKDNLNNLKKDFNIKFLEDYL